MNFMTLKNEELVEAINLLCPENMPESSEDHPNPRGAYLKALKGLSVEQYFEAKGVDGLAELRGMLDVPGVEEVEDTTGGDDTTGVEDEPTSEVEDEAPAPVAPKATYIVKMDRDNPRYEIAGMLFTKSHPYNVVDAETADYLVRNIEGFRLALPSEIQEYYG